MRYLVTVNASAAFPSVERWRLRASDFELLHAAGALAEVRKGELIDGDIYEMSPQLARHSRVKTALAMALIDRLKAIGSQLEAIIEVSVVVASDSVPEPDIVVTSYKGDCFVPADTVALVAEIAESTLDRDLGRKAALYAAAGIPEYWVVDVSAQQVVIQWQHRTDGYAARRDVAFGGTLVSVAVPGLDVSTAGLTI